MKKEDLKVGMKIVHDIDNYDIRTISALGKNSYLYVINNQELFDYFNNLLGFHILKEIKKITLYRFTYQREDKSVFTVNWDSDNQPDIMNRHFKIVKTDTREIEIDE